MNKKTTMIGGALAAAALLPGIASASLILDTGIPTGTTGPVVLNSAGWYAAEFSDATSSEITTVSAYVGSGTGSFTFDIYADNLSNVSFTTGKVNTLSVLATGTGTFSSAGWVTTTLDWTPGAQTTSADGKYWIALEETTTGRNAPTFDLPEETSASTGTAPALAFALEKSGTSGVFSESGAPAIGLQVNAVPLPAGLWLLGSGLFGLGFAGRRNRARQSSNPQ
jgi:hypothetical protein